MPVERAIELFDSLATPVALYASELWLPSRVLSESHKKIRSEFLSYNFFSLQNKYALIFVNGLIIY